VDWMDQGRSRGGHGLVMGAGWRKVVGWDACHRCFQPMPYLYPILHSMLWKPRIEEERELGPCCRNLSGPIHPVAGTMLVGSPSKVHVHTTLSCCLVLADFLRRFAIRDIKWYMQSKPKV